MTEHRRPVALAPLALVVVIALLSASPIFAQTPSARWTGFYCGASGGVGQGSPNVTTTSTLVYVEFGALHFSTSELNTLANASAKRMHSQLQLAPGVSAGYDWQRGRVVFGGAVDFTPAAFDGSRDSSVAFADGSGGTFRLIQSVKATSRGSLGGRFGMVKNQRLYYVSAGITFTRLSYQSSYSDLFTIGPTNESGGGDKTAAGWLIGGGVERRLRPHLTMAVDYRRIDSGEVSTTSTNLTAVRSGVLMKWGIPFTNAGSLVAQSVRIGMNYRF